MPMGMCDVDDRHASAEGVGVITLRDKIRIFAQLCLKRL